MVKITSSISSSSPRFTILHDAGFVNCCILFWSQKTVSSYAVGYLFIVLRDVFSYFAYICQADMFFAPSCLNSALLNLVACALSVIVSLPYLKDVRISSTGLGISML